MRRLTHVITSVNNYLFYLEETDESEHADIASLLLMFGGPVIAGLLFVWAVLI